MTKALKIAEEYVRLNGTASPSGYEEYSEWCVNLKAIFAQYFLDHAPTNAAVIDRLNKDVGLDKETNPELVAPWLQLAIGSGLESAPFNIADNFLGRVGRMKFVLPVYGAVNQISHDNAVRIYNSHRDFYHPIAVDLIDKMLEIKEDDGVNMMANMRGFLA